VRNETLQRTLDLLFEAQPLTYTLQEKMVVIARKAPAVTPAKDAGSAVPVTVTGEVRDGSGEPLPDATI
jgi:protocatechuate 3,4-dioxygenase beta subunit